MPRKPKAIRWGRVRENRVLYVSWLISEDPKDYTQWMKTFWGRLLLIPALHRNRFVSVLRTGDAEAATVLSKRLDESNITDIVAVLTNVYLHANIAAGERAKAELAHFFDQALKKHARASRTETDLETPIQFFLAPLDPPTWTMPIREVLLSDRRLTKLRDQRFTWPSEAPAKVADEIAAAVALIVGDSEG
jgi:hypothetical protein